MRFSPRRVVLDTNVILRGVSRASSPSGLVLALCDRRWVIPLVSRAVLREYRSVLNEKEIRERYPHLTEAVVEKVLSRLSYVGETIRGSSVRFAFPRDPKDAKFVELAIAGEATTIVTCDRGLLESRTARTEAGRRFRQRLPVTDVVTPDVFLAWYEQGRINEN